ncbi:CDP-alcohol phosphatidyltransferase family protein [Polaribacter sp.]|uniref:CDP-alcohol phosphatidyltransferase family protein n=1 Tax=Polaribacter sp. TaxID=1920175 RepID=UPI004047FD92
MKIKSHIPNLLTLANLFCGVVATMYAVKGFYEMTAIFVVIGILFDFLDGFVARILGVSGELGKQLDSLADVVTSGVVPGLLLFFLIKTNVINGPNVEMEISFGQFEPKFGLLPYVAFLLTIAAAYRLAKFNIDTRQSDSFIGLPTPAMSLFVISLPLIYQSTDIQMVKTLLLDNNFLVGIAVVLSLLMNLEIPLFSLKFKDFSIKKNAVKYVFLLISVGLIFLLKYMAVPIIITFYVLLSLVTNLFKKA